MTLNLNTLHFMNGGFPSDLRPKTVRADNIGHFFHLNDNLKPLNLLNNKPKSQQEHVI